MAQTTYPEVPEDFKLYFFTLGDVNGDGKIDMADVALIIKARVTQDLEYDINGDGKVDMRDVGMALRNFGKDIETEWHKTYDAQQEAILESKVTGASVVPWYIEWARELAKHQSANDKAYTMWLDPAMQSFMDSLKVMENHPDAYWKANIDNADDLLDAQINASKKISRKVINDALQETPMSDTMEHYGLSKQLGEYLANKYGIVLGSMPQERMINDKTSADELDLIAKNVAAASIDASLFNWVISDLSAGAVSFQKDILDVVKKQNIWDTMITTPSALRYQLNFVEPATQYFKSIYTPYIPSIGDAVRMRANGKLTDEEYTEIMLLNGYDEFWTAKYWDAHWTKPAVTDALTAWRRDKITDDQLNAIMINADLDPAWTAIWDERKYLDLNIGMAHTLYDIGLIDDAKLFDTVKRNGYVLDDAMLIADSIKQFPIRRIKLRVLLAVANGVAIGALDHMHLVAIVAKLGYDQKLVDWLEIYGNVRREITASKTTKAPKEKLLSLGDLKAAYLRGLVTEDVFRTELLTRNYSLEDIQILLALMGDRRTVEQAGGKMYALSVIELLNAWRYEVITEDDLRNKLLARGLPLDELDTLIATKKVQWKITPQTAG